MLHTNDLPTIQKILVDRVALEQEIALNLSKMFNTGELHSKINVAVWAAFSFLQGLKSEQVIANKITLLEKGNSFLFDKDSFKDVEGVVNYMDFGGRLTAEQCGNLIRFYGEVIEQCADLSIYWREERARQISMRYGGGGEAFRFRRDSNYVAQADRGSVWQKEEFLEKNKKTPYGFRGVGGGRIRTKAGTFFSLPGTGGKVANPYYDIVPGNLFENETMKNLHVGKQTGGVMVWKITDSSTIGKIDRVFGLPYGADISGTTTDNLYFLSGWADVSKGDPLVMMLPLAAIVGEYHHSLLEVAAAMSLRKVVNYSIGFYSTLLPNLPSDVKPMSQRSAIEGLLKTAEEDTRNKHVLLYYGSTSKIAGCYLAEGGDLGAFKKLATVDIRLWPKFKVFPPYPGEDNVMQLISESGLSNALLGSRRGALRSTGQKLW